MNKKNPAYRGGRTALPERCAAAGGIPGIPGIPGSSARNPAAGRAVTPGGPRGKRFDNLNYNLPFP